MASRRIALLVVCLLPGITMSAQGIIGACVNATNGNLRIATSDACRTHETFIEWSVAGPAGPQGPAGADGTPGVSHQMVGGGAAINQTTVYAPMFGAPGLTINESAMLVPMAHAGTLSNVRVRFRFGPGSGQSIVVTVRQNAADTGLTCTVTDDDAICSDLTNAVVFAAGDVISVRGVPTPGSRNDNRFWWTATFTP